MALKHTTSLTGATSRCHGVSSTTWATHVDGHLTADSCSAAYARASLPGRSLRRRTLYYCGLLGSPGICAVVDTSSFTGPSITACARRCGLAIRDLVAVSIWGLYTRSRASWGPIRSAITPKVHKITPQNRHSIRGGPEIIFLLKHIASPA